MSVISIFGGVYSGSEAMLDKISGATGFGVIRDADLVAEACRRFGMDPERVENAMYGKASAFNNLTRERERSIACLKIILAERLAEERVILTGFATHLVPESVSHVLRVLFIAGAKHRAEEARSREGISPKRAEARVRAGDEAACRWTFDLFGEGPWDPSLYDIVIPTDQVEAEDAAALILEHLEHEAVRVNEHSRRAVMDFALAASVELALVRKGHDVGVEASGGEVTLTINRKVLLLARLEEELSRVAGGVPGVSTVVTKVGKGFNQADICRKFEGDVSYKVLLVDDEREYVQTLSERLQMRDVGARVAYDGESALAMVRESEPDVMVLDLKMPGIDGEEVLRRVKEECPEMEVIILTGHGCEESRRRCMELGAYAYLRKPMDIGKLTGTMAAAYARLRRRAEERRLRSA